MQVRPPYRKCPFCRRQAFGVAAVLGDHYERRCALCGKPHWTQPPARYNLPPLDKKIIYLDQFAISNMMKALHPAFAFKQIDAFWRELFERLDQLCKLGAIVCPWSMFLAYESSMTEDHDALLRMGDQLSASVSFVGPDYIKAIQLRAFARAWATQTGVDPREVESSRVIKPSVNAWREAEFTVPYVDRTKAWIEQYNRLKAEIQADHSGVFERWKAESKKGFEDWFVEECKGFATGIQLVVERHLSRKAAGNEPPIPDLLTAVWAAQQVLQETGAPGRDSVLDFLCSPLLEQVPFVRITSSLFAAIADRGAHQGKLRYPTSDMRNDINVVAHLLPYCDAMFLDRECVGLVRERKVQEKVGCGTVLFCHRERSELIAYLDSIRQSVPPAQARAAIAVYGREWLRPSDDMYAVD